MPARFVRADRASAATMRANQLRLWLASFAYVLMHGLRRIGLDDTRVARATCATIRTALLKIGAQVTVSVRRVARGDGFSLFEALGLFARASAIARRAGLSPHEPGTASDPRFASDPGCF
jgi:hypothetical protein